jgi:hypothetical protein
MGIVRLPDWNGRDIEAVRSKGGVWAFPDFTDNVIRTEDSQWPPPELVQKLCQSQQLSAFLPGDQSLLTRKLGYYSDLQSINSEDAIQWSYFGPLVYGSASQRVAFTNWLLGCLGLPWRTTACCFQLWRRVPHPDNLTPGGPEIDLLIHGHSCVIFCESKWRSGEGRWQGIEGKSTQLELRCQFLERYGRRLYGDVDFAVLYIVLDESQRPSPVTSSSPPVHVMRWADLCGCAAHPRFEEIRSYYNWKRDLIARKWGAPAPG